jgi:hypothetical protein
LKTTSIDGSTFIEPSDAKEWLKTKGRYLSITRHFGKAEIDLSRSGFSNTYDAWQYIEERFGARHLSPIEFNRAAGAALEEADAERPEEHLPYSRIHFGPAMARDSALMETFARVLELDPAVFRWRMLEAAAREELEEAQMHLRSLSPPG